MCTTSVNMSAVNDRLDAPPQDYYYSPSSIAEVDDYSNSAEIVTKRRKVRLFYCLCDLFR